MQQQRIYQKNKKHQQSSLQSLRQRFHFSIRKKKIQQQFQKQRQQLLTINNQKNHQNRKNNHLNLKQQFDQLFSIITDQKKFAENRKLIRYYSSQECNCFQTLKLTGYIYDYFIQNQYDYDCIQLIKIICWYSEVQIPQTQQFVDTLMKLIKYSQNENLSLNQNSNDKINYFQQNNNINKKKQYYENSSLYIITLLLNYHEYEQKLRDMLIEKGILCYLEKFTYESINIQKKNQQQMMKHQQQQQQQQQQQMFKKNQIKLSNNNNYTYTFKQQQQRILLISQIYCQILSSLPSIQEKLFSYIINQLSDISQYFQIDFLIGQLFFQINNKFKPNQNISRYIMQSMQKFCLINTQNCGEQIIGIFKYCARSNYLLTQDCFKLILRVVQTHHEFKCKKLGLQCIILFLKKEEFSLSQFTDLKSFNLSFDLNFSSNNKQKQKQKIYTQQFKEKALQTLIQIDFITHIIKIFNKQPQFQQPCIQILHLLITLMAQYEQIQQKQGLQIFKKLMNQNLSDIIQLLQQCLQSLQVKKTTLGLQILSQLLVLDRQYNDQSQDLNKLSFKEIIKNQLRKKIDNISQHNLPLKINQKIEELIEDIIEILDEQHKYQQQL